MMSNEERIIVYHVMKCPAIDGGHGRLAKPVGLVVSNRGSVFCSKCQLAQPCGEHAKWLKAENKETV